MIRQESLEEISDGKLYSENDCVKADTGNCAGCRQVCCKGMEASIVLDPYDVYRLTQKTGKSFNELINDKIEINIVDGIMLPNMRMDPDTNACGFLLNDNRCAIHDARPGVCRMFPLGRYWEDDTHFKYILQKGQCNKDNLFKIKVKKWIDMHEGEPYREFIILWHVYLKQIKSAALNLDEQQLRILCMYTLKTFFVTPYMSSDADGFFREVRERIQKAYTDLGMR